MSTININSGISTIGNYTSENIDLAGVDSNVKSIKTLVGGKWKSWSLGAPDAFQGFLALEKGYGFVVNSNANAIIDASDIDIDINDVTINNGLNFLCFPYANKTIMDGYLPKVKISSAKAIIGSWKSWSIGAPNAFQGFLSVDKNNGYVVNVDKKFGAYLSNYKRENSTGVRIGTSYGNTTGNEGSSNLVQYTPDSIYNTIDYEAVTINPALPLKDMWVNINGTVKLFSYPQELEGKLFNIKENLLDITTYGLITESVDVTDTYGEIIDAASETIDLGDLTGGLLQTNIVYTGIFTSPVGNSETNPVVVDTVLDVNSMEIMYDVKAIPAEANMNKMLINAGGVKTVIEFADVYVGDSFILIKDGVLYNGTFTVSNTAYITL